MAFQNRVDALRELMRRGWRPLIDEEGGVSGLLSSMVDAYDIEQLEAFVRLDGVRSLSIAAALVDRYNDFEQGQLKIEVREMKSLVGVLYRPAGMSMTEAREKCAQQLGISVRTQISGENSATELIARALPSTVGRWLSRSVQIPSREALLTRISQLNITGSVLAERVAQETRDPSLVEQVKRLEEVVSMQSELIKAQRMIMDELTRQLNQRD